MKTIVGAYLIDAPFTALNNSGIDKKAANENEVATKTIYSPEGVRPYVSAQALRYWWRNILEEKFNWKCSPVEKIKANQAVTEADPLEYDDDDIFGYMSARKEEVEGKKNPVNVTVTRVSPLKCSPLIGLPIRPTSDFGVMNRKFEGNPVLFNHQFYSNILKGIFALDLDTAGVFTSIDKPGSKNLSADLVNKYGDEGLMVGEDGKKFAAPSDLRNKRVTETVSALRYLNGGAMQTLHHTDVTPKLIILAAINSGNNIFMDIFPHNSYDNGLINLDALSEVLEDYKDDLLTGVYIGRFSGFGTANEEEIMHFKAPEGVELTVTSPAKAIDKFAMEISEKKALFEA